jgi:hypothetical protein
MPLYRFIKISFDRLRKAAETEQKAIFSDWRKASAGQLRRARRSPKPPR